MVPDETPEATPVACPKCGHADEIAELSRVETKHRVTLLRDEDGGIDVKHADVASQTLWDTDRPFGFWCDSCDHEFTLADVTSAPPARPGERQACPCGSDRFEECVVVNAYAPVHLIAGQDPAPSGGYQPAWDTLEPELLRCLGCGELVEDRAALPAAQGAEEQAR